MFKQAGEFVRLGNNRNLRRIALRQRSGIGPQPGHPPRRIAAPERFRIAAGDNAFDQVRCPSGFHVRRKVAGYGAGEEVGDIALFYLCLRERQEFDRLDPASQ